LERAFLDTLYLYKNYHFDNLSPINWKKVFEILPIYRNKALEKRVKNYAIAIPERAFLDTLYLYKKYHFDNLSPINWKKVFEILPIYQNKALEKRIKKYHQEFKKE